MLRNVDFCHFLFFLGASIQIFFGQENDLKLSLHLSILICSSAHCYAAYNTAWKEFSDRNVVCWEYPNLVSYTVCSFQL